MFQVFLLLTVLLTAQIAFAGDRTHYPRDSAAEAYELLGIFKGNWKDFFVLSIQTRLDPTFSDEQKTLIRDAMELFMQRALKPEVLDCAFRSADKNLPRSRSAFETQMAVALSPFETGGLYLSSFVFIARYWNDAGSVGLGYLNLFFDPSNPTPGLGIRHHLYIALNSDFMGSTSKYQEAKDTEYWAGVIAHEFAHNLGYDHKTDEYKGYFVEEYGQCLWMNGARAETPRGVKHDRVIKKPEVGR